MMIIWMFLLVFRNSQAFILTDTHPDTYLSIVQIANKYGYPMETHKVTTDDGYILTIFRIPHGKNSSGIVNGKPIILFHGLFGQAENFIVNAVHNGSIAHNLADNGFDVWLVNSRGTQHGREHSRLKESQDKFWDFSWHEIGIFDIPAFIDYILKITGKKKLYYLGHSQGGTVFYVSASMKPEIQEKIALAILLAPSAFFQHSTWSFVKRLSRIHKDLQNIMVHSFGYEFPNQKNDPSELVFNLCVNSSFTQVCMDIMNMLNIDHTMMGDWELFALLSRFIPTVSMKQLIHYAQLVDAAGPFRQWDYGTKELNSEIYGSSIPPDYSVEKITIPTILFVGLSDNLVDYRDVNHMCQKIQKCLNLFIMKDRNWGHIDYLAHIEAQRKFIEPMIRLIEKI